MSPDLWELYRQMLRSRLFEEAVALLWHEGLISGEMHLGTGEEAVYAGVVSHLSDGDAMAVDHRGTAPLLMRGVDPVLLMREFLGRADGLCGGAGGHMHLFAPEKLAASSGIVGASGPTAAGFALAATHLRPGKLAVSFSGEGTMNQGMMLEALNLAAAWHLPVVFVCRDNGWAISSRSAGLTGGTPRDRARGFGLPAVSVDGLDVAAVWRAAGEACERARSGGGPGFIHATCVHRDGHFLGDQLLRTARRPAAEMPRVAGPMLRSAVRPRGLPVTQRLAGMLYLTGLSGEVAAQTSDAKDPVKHTRRQLVGDLQRLEGLEAAVLAETQQVVDRALAEAGPESSGSAGAGQEG